MYLGSEYFTGFANVNTVSVVDTWLKFVGMNILWVVFPGIFIYESVRYLVAGGTSPFLVSAPGDQLHVRMNRLLTALIFVCAVPACGDDSSGGGPDMAAVADLASGGAVCTAARAQLLGSIDSVSTGNVDIIATNGGTRTIFVDASAGGINGEASPSLDLREPRSGAPRPASPTRARSRRRRGISRSSVRSSTPTVATAGRGRAAPCRSPKTSRKSPPPTRPARPSPPSRSSMRSAIRSSIRPAPS